MPVVASLHPRTADRMREFGIDDRQRCRFVPPLGFFDFVRLEQEALLRPDGQRHRAGGVLHLRRART